MFEVDVKGLVELEGGKPPHRLAFEPVANVFDEYRGYGGDRKRPSFCAVTLSRSQKPRGVTLTVADDGPGFANERDVWTLFGSTPKRSAAGVSGRFNLGDKQLIAVARSATIRTNRLTVVFDGGERCVTRHREPVVQGTIVECLMPWSLADMAEVREQLRQVIPPQGLSYTVDGQQVTSPRPKCEVSVILPTVLLADGVLRPTTRKTKVRVLETDNPTLYELGVPICGLDDVAFPFSLDVQQKVPVPTSRDTVSPTYLYRLIGSVIEAAAMDGIRLLTEEQQGAGFIRAALDWIREPEALAVTVKSLFGESAVRHSTDPIANAQAAAAGCTLVTGRWFTPETRRRMEQAHVLPTSKEKFGGIEQVQSAGESGRRCPRCGAPL